MLPKNKRIHREKDIAFLLARGRRIFGKLVILRYYLVSKDKPARCGFIVSKKVHNKPVKRNLVKRRLRAIVASVLPKLSPSVDLLISAKPESVGATHRQLQDEVVNLLSKSKLLEVNKN